MVQGFATKRDAPSVTIDSSRYLEFDQVAIRVVSRWDITSLNGQAIADITLTS